jgi:hypothetical protein
MNKEEKDFDKSLERFKERFYKVLGIIFIYARVPIIFVWIALLVGIILGVLAK